MRGRFLGKEALALPSPLQLRGLGSAVSSLTASRALNFKPHRLKSILACFEADRVHLVTAGLTCQQMTNTNIGKASTLADTCNKKHCKFKKTKQTSEIKERLQRLFGQSE